jgi:hypothetical protein
MLKGRFKISQEIYVTCNLESDKGQKTLTQQRIKTNNKSKTFCSHKHNETLQQTLRYFANDRAYVLKQVFMQRYTESTEFT